MEETRKDDEGKEDGHRGRGTRTVQRPLLHFHALVEGRVEGEGVGVGSQS